MKKFSWVPVLLGGIVVGGLAGYGISVGCKAHKASGTVKDGVTMVSGDTSPTCSAELDKASDGLFVLDGQTYHKSDLPESLRSDLYEIEHESYERVSAIVKSFAAQLALARSKSPKSSAANLPPFEELLGPVDISDAQAKEFFEKNKGRIPPDSKFEDLKDKIKQYMVGEARSGQLRDQIAEMEKKGRLKIIASEPEAPTVNIDVGSFPSRGPQDAKVVLIEISDYQCPHCIRSQPEIEALLKSSGSKFKFVQINFALHPDGLSGALARGAYCASQQGSEKFWAYHSAAFGVSPEEKVDAALKRLAQTASLDVTKLLACVDSEEAKAFITKTAKSMNDVGIKGTPTFVLNNKRLGHGSITESVVSVLK